MADITWHEEGTGLAAELNDWRLEVFPAEEDEPHGNWIWQAAIDRSAGPYLTAREVLQEGFTDSLETAQARAIKAMDDQEFAWSEMETPTNWKTEAVQRRQHDHTWVWNGSNFQCQCGATSANNAEVK